MSGTYKIKVDWKYKKLKCFQKENHREIVKSPVANCEWISVVNINFQVLLSKVEGHKVLELQTTCWLLFFSPPSHIKFVDFLDWEFRSRIEKTSAKVEEESVSALIVTLSYSSVPRRYIHFTARALGFEQGSAVRECLPPWASVSSSVAWG